MAQFGTDGVKAKVGATAGPGLSLGGAVGRPEVECRNQVIGSDQTIPGSAPDAEKIKSQLLEGVQTAAGPDDFVANTSTLTSKDYAPTNVDLISTSSYATPKYGNYCGPDWIGGMYDAGNVCRVDWKPPVDQLDEACRDHDYDYVRSDLSAQTPNSNPDKQEADLELLEKADGVSNDDLGIYGDIYKQGVKEVFGYKTGTDGTLVATDDVLDSVKQGVSNAWDWSKDKAGDAWDWTKDKTSDFLGSSFPIETSAVGGGTTIIAAESDAEKLSEEADSHADRAASAARKAQSAARRAAAIVARMRAMMSRRYS
jgi:hypothetical protein